MEKEQLEADLNSARQKVAELETLLSGTEQSRQVIQKMSDDRFHPIIENMLEGAQIIGFDWRYIYLNATAEKHNRRSNQELLGNVYMEMWPGVEATHVFAMIKRCMEERIPHQMENEFVFPDGSPGWFELRIQPIPEGVFILSIDVTKSKRAELKIRESEERYRMLFENSLDAILLSVPDGNILAANPAACRLFEQTEDEIRLVGRDKLVDMTDPRLKPALDERSRTGKFYGELTFLHKNGSKFPVEISSNIFKDSDGRELASLFIRDISERKQADEQLAKLVERLDLATSAARMGIWDWDIENNELIWDEQMYALYGLKLGEFGGAYEAWLNGVHPDDRAMNDEISERARRGEIEYSAEFRVIWPDGSVHWLKANGDVFRDKNGMPIRMIGMNYDITEQKRAEEALKASEQKYSVLFDMAAMPASLSKMPENTLVQVNDAFEKLFGYTQQEVFGKTSLELGMVRPEERVRTVNEVQQFGSALNNEKHVFTKSGEMRTILVNVSMAEISGQKYAITTIQDITERKQMEDALRQSQDNFARAFNSNPAALTITRLADGKFLSINESYTDVMGYEPAEILGRAVKELNIYVNPDERNQLIEQLREQGRVRNYELSVRHKTGEARNLLVSMEPVLYNHEDSILSTFIDITERKHMENELRRSNAELEQFAYVASHDLQEPLRTVAGMVQLLQQRYKGQLDERADEYIRHTVEAANRMQALINDLLAYSRIDRHGKTLRPVNVQQVLDVALANLQVSIQETGAEITCAKLPSVLADPMQLTQLFQNLISNAIKFHGERIPQIQIKVTNLSGFYQFSVWDNGIGIEPQYFERIFLVFQRLHTRREYPGTGIGLALCKKIIERHNGQIWVESIPGEGTKFHFTLPKVPGESNPPQS